MDRSRRFYGSATNCGAAEVVEFATLFTVTVSGAAFATVEMPRIVRAAAVTIAIFFLVFIYTYLVRIPVQDYGLALLLTNLIF